MRKITAAAVLLAGCATTPADVEEMGTVDVEPEVTVATTAEPEPEPEQEPVPMTREQRIAAAAAELDRKAAEAMREWEARKQRLEASRERNSERVISNLRGIGELARGASKADDLAERVRQAQPNWHAARDLFIDDFAKTQTWPVEEIAAVRKGSLWVGATWQHVMLSWGYPTDNTRTVAATGTVDIWVFPGNRSVTMVDGKVQSMTGR